MAVVNGLWRLSLVLALGSACGSRSELRPGQIEGDTAGVGASAGTGVGGTGVGGGAGTFVTVAGGPVFGGSSSGGGDGPCELEPGDCRLPEETSCPANALCTGQLGQHAELFAEDVLVWALASSVDAR
jgi:hypothetical protein